MPRVGVGFLRKGSELSPSSPAGGSSEHCKLHQRGLLKGFIAFLEGQGAVSEMNRRGIVEPPQSLPFPPVSRQF